VLTPPRRNELQLARLRGAVSAVFDGKPAG